MRVLFLCSRARKRSVTAAEHFAAICETDFAGLAPDADVPLEPEAIEEADVIVVMEARHKQLLGQRFPKAVRGKRVVVLGIPDRFEAGDPALVERLEQTRGRWWRSEAGPR